MVNPKKLDCECSIVEKDVSNVYYGIVPKNRCQSSVIGPRELKCSSCLPSLSEENKKLTLSKLIEIFTQSTRYRKPRVHTYPSKKQRLMRLQRKKLNSLKKLSRKSPKTDD